MTPMAGAEETATTQLPGKQDIPHPLPVFVRNSDKTPSHFHVFMTLETRYTTDYHVVVYADNARSCKEQKKPLNTLLGKINEFPVLELLCA